MKTLRIIGSGMRGIHHLTQESIKNLMQAKKILWLGATEGLKEFIIQNNLNGEDITYFYENGALDSDNYLRIKNRVLEELDNLADVALVVLGHPRLGVSIVQEFQQDANSGSFNLNVLPGISSFDTMINDLNIDPIEEGTCLIDANRLILYNYQMDPCLNYLIYHVCSIGNSNTDYEEPNINNAVIFLKNKLMVHFPEEHEITLLSSDSSGVSEATSLKGTIKNIELLLKSVSFDSSLFIPGILPKSKQINKKFYEFLTNKSSSFENLNANKQVMD
ncbi:MAG: SAM-dependent methyltransferase [Gammaproteobacteria bacterium]